jgi:hypothetical protein
MGTVELAFRIMPAVFPSLGPSHRAVVRPLFLKMRGKQSISRLMAGKSRLSEPLQFRREPNVKRAGLCDFPRSQTGSVRGSAILRRAKREACGTLRFRRAPNGKRAGRCDFAESQTGSVRCAAISQGAKREACGALRFRREPNGKRAWRCDFAKSQTGSARDAAISQ